MPKDEFDFEDPLELNGVSMLTQEDTSAEMAETFTEEFMRIGYNARQILALFRNPHYLGPRLVLEQHGEPFVRELIAEVFARWGRTAWAEANAGTAETPTSAAEVAPAATEAAQTTGMDPMGCDVPKLNL
jgi:hypothetical protein